MIIEDPAEIGRALQDAGLPARVFGWPGSGNNLWLGELLPLGWDDFEGTERLALEIIGHPKRVGEGPSPVSRKIDSEFHQ